MARFDHGDTIDDLISTERAVLGNIVLVFRELEDQRERHLDQAFYTVSFR
jgi:hypothetical protein